jgi:osmotically-inducible protein OsmY
MNRYTLVLQGLGRPLLAMTIGISVLTGLSGCAAVLVAGAAGGAMSTSDRRTYGSQTEDAGIEIKGAGRISTVFGDAVHVDVTSYNRKVLLTGQVKDEDTKAKVETEIKAIANVQSVVNEIQVAMFLSSFSGHSNDAYLSTRARGVLIGTADIYSSSFKVVTEAGVVYLMGRVSQREGDTAADSVRGIPGVKKVVKVFEYIDEGEVKNYVTAKPADAPAAPAEPVVTTMPVTN